MRISPADSPRRTVACVLPEAPAVVTTNPAIRQLERQSETRKRAAADRSIRGAPLTVYLFLSDELADDEFRQVKVSGVAKFLHLKHATAAQAMHRLVAAGYLERSSEPRQVRSYRLRWVDLPTEKAG